MSNLGNCVMSAVGPACVKTDIKQHCDIKAFISLLSDTTNYYQARFLLNNNQDQFTGGRVFKRSAGNSGRARAAYADSTSLSDATPIICITRFKL